MKYCDNNKMCSKAATNMANIPVKPTRPYTEYNIFFQLEREYILQVEFNVTPDLGPDNVFAPENDAEYRGPPLPSKYDGLVLPSDWYVPGKEKRRKRKHRKSHGKIGFHELSNKIAKKWKSADGIDDETRVFCACVSDISVQQYKKEVKNYKSALEKNLVKEQVTPREKNQIVKHPDNSNRATSHASVNDVQTSSMPFAAPQDLNPNQGSPNQLFGNLLKTQVIPSMQSNHIRPLRKEWVDGTSNRAAFENIEEFNFYMSFFQQQSDETTSMNKNNTSHDTMIVNDRNVNEKICRNQPKETKTDIPNASHSSESAGGMHDNEILGVFWKPSPNSNALCKQSRDVAENLLDSVTRGGMDNTTAHREQARGFVEICADAATSGGIEHTGKFAECPTDADTSGGLDNMDKMDSANPAINNIGNTNNFNETTSPSYFLRPEPVMSNNDTSVQSFMTSSISSMEAKLKKDMEEVEHLRSLLYQQQTRLRKLKKRSAVASPA